MTHQRLALAIALLFSAAAEGALSWMLIVHVPWLGWPLTIVSVAGLAYALQRRSTRKARARTSTATGE